MPTPPPTPSIPSRSRRPAAAAAFALATVGLVLGLGAGHPAAWLEGPPTDRVGACGFGPTCRESGCHSTFPVGSMTLTWDLRVEAPAPGPMPSFYLPDQAYDLRLEVTDASPEAAIWGFQLSTLAACPIPVPGGRLEILEPDRTRVDVGDFDLQYLAHDCTGCPATQEPWCCGFVPPLVPDGNAWTFRWTAPARGSGPVDFALAFNAANWDGTPDFDRISLGELRLEEEPCPPPVTDLRVSLTDCDPGAPGERRALLQWTPAGAGDQLIRELDDRALLGTPPTSWPAAADACRPLDGRLLVFYSVAGTCELGSEGPH